MMPPKDDPRSERDFPEQTPEQAMDAIRRDISWQDGWDAAIDAAAKKAHEHGATIGENCWNHENNKQESPSTCSQEIETAILALKGDRNVAGS